MKLRELMTREIKILNADATIKEAAQLMKDLDVGVLPISEGGELAGIITDRDIVMRVVAEGHDPNDTVVRYVMTKEVETCMEDQDVDEAARLMEDRQIRRLVVLNKDRQVAGILSLGDIAESDTEQSGAILKDVSKPSKPKR